MQAWIERVDMLDTLRAPGNCPVDIDSSPTPLLATGTTSHGRHFRPIASPCQPMTQGGLGGSRPALSRSSAKQDPQPRDQDRTPRAAVRPVDTVASLASRPSRTATPGTPILQFRPRDLRGGNGYPLRSDVQIDDEPNFRGDAPSERPASRPLAEQGPRRPKPSGARTPGLGWDEGSHLFRHAAPLGAACPGADLQAEAPLPPQGQASCVTNTQSLDGLQICSEARIT
jgi:hypothetical protein